MRETIEQLRAAGYKNVGLNLDRWYAPEAQPFNATMTLEQATAQMIHRREEDAQRAESNRILFIKQRVWRKWAETRAGKAFHNYDAAIGHAWVADCREHSNTKGPWMRADAAKEELIAAIREIQGFDFDAEFELEKKRVEEARAEAKADAHP